jgi:zinc transport system substrate-binding protein
MHFSSFPWRGKRLFSLLPALLLLASLLLGGCGSSPSEKRDSQGRLTVIATFYPMAEFARQVGGSHVVVTTLVPDGTEPHDWEPRPSDLGRIAGSALFLYNGGVETWVPQALEAIGVGKAHALEVGRGLIRQDDPHVWNSPRQAMAEVRVIRDELIRLDPSHQTDYEHNAAAYLQKLGALDKELSRVAATAKRKEFVTTHAAFGYIARDYGLVQIPVMGINPESEPSPADMARLVRLMKEKQIRYIAFETLVSPKVAETLANSTGAQTYVLNPLEGLTKEERDRGDDFVTVLARNIRSLQTALNE